MRKVQATVLSRRAIMFYSTLQASKKLDQDKYKFLFAWLLFSERSDQSRRGWIHDGWAVQDLISIYTTHAICVMDSLSRQMAIDIFRDMISPCNVHMPLQHLIVAKAQQHNNNKQIQKNATRLNIITASLTVYVTKHLWTCLSMWPKLNNNANGDFEIFLPYQLCSEEGDPVGI